MSEFWAVFWKSFCKICQLEFRNVSFINLIIFSLIGACFVHIGCLIYVRRKRQSIYLSTELTIDLLIFYINFIVQATLVGRELEGQARVFDTKWLWIDSSMDQNMTNLLNIIMFIPFGILVTGIQMNQLIRKRIFMVINYCFLTSLIIECAQYITKTGYFEIDDIEANIVGGFTGSIFFSLCYKIGKFIHRRSMEVKNEKSTQTGHV